MLEHALNISAMTKKLLFLIEIIQRRIMKPNTSKQKTHIGVGRILKRLHRSDTGSLGASWGVIAAPMLQAKLLVEGCVAADSLRCRKATPH